MDSQNAFLKKPLYKRLFFSALLVAICYYTIFMSPGWFFFLVVEAFILLGLAEFFSMAEKKRLHINKVLGLIFGAILPLSFFVPGESVIVVVTILCLFVYNFHRELKQYALLSTAVTIFGIFYVAWFFSFFMKIKFLPDGANWVAYVILVTKLGDAGAYFVGRKLGKHKFIPHISPNKSIEGSTAGFTVSLIVSFLCKFMLPHVSFVHLAVLGVTLGILAQLGDLAESLIKRDVGVKDSGNIPGLGGILDVIDSLLFTVPFTHYYITAFPGLLSS